MVRRTWESESERERESESESEVLVEAQQFGEAHQPQDAEHAEQREVLGGGAFEEEREELHGDAARRVDPEPRAAGKWDVTCEQRWRSGQRAEERPNPASLTVDNWRRWRRGR